MFIACDENGQRRTIEEAYEIRDKHPDAKFFCPHPQCGKELILKGRGSKIAPHFAHRKNINCIDTWKYNDMSEWHKAWQERFPEEYREVYLELNGESHRADILIESEKTVIEFQHSSIRAKEFEARNAFYKACGYFLIWVFDATDMTKYDNEGLCWERRRKIFENMKNPPGYIFLQNYRPEESSEKLLWTKTPPIKYLLKDAIAEFIPECLLKQFGLITDEGISTLTEIGHAYLAWEQQCLRKVQPTYRPRVQNVSRRKPRF